MKVEKILSYIRERSDVLNNLYENPEEFKNILSGNETECDFLFDEIFDLLKTLENYFSDMGY